MRQPDIQKNIARHFQANNAPIQTAVNAFVVSIGSHQVLIDSGASNCFGPTMGRLFENLKAAGIEPAKIDTILLTHLHPDHVCGIATLDGHAAFPNATVWASDMDAEFWLKSTSEARLPEQQHSFIKMSRGAVAPYTSRGRFKTFKDHELIVPGLSVVPSNGHTPGHSSYLVESNGEKILIWGDIVHFHAIQFPHPEVSIDVDVDPKRAVASRLHILTETARNSWLVAAAHLPFPGLGHVRNEPPRLSWRPVSVSQAGMARLLSCL